MSRLSTLNMHDSHVSTVQCLKHFCSGLTLHSQGRRPPNKGEVYWSEFRFCATPHSRQYYLSSFGFTEAAYPQTSAKADLKPGVVAHACNSSTLGSWGKSIAISWRSAWVKSEILSQKKETDTRIWQSIKLDVEEIYKKCPSVTLTNFFIWRYFFTKLCLHVIGLLYFKTDF